MWEHRNIGQFWKGTTTPMGDPHGTHLESTADCPEVINEECLLFPALCPIAVIVLSLNSDLI